MYTNDCVFTIGRTIAKFHSKMLAVPTVKHLLHTTPGTDMSTVTFQFLFSGLIAIQTFPHLLSVEIF